MKIGGFFLIAIIVFAPLLVLSADVHKTLAATLLFSSGWESPVDYTDSTKTHFKGSDKGFSWSNLKHEIDYIGSAAGTNVDSKLSTYNVHSGSRSLYQAVLQKAPSGQTYANLLVFYASDTNPPAGWLGSPNICVSEWVWYPSDMTLPTYGWMCVGSYRELRSPSPDFSISLFIYKDPGQPMYWYVQGILYGSSSNPQTRFWEAENHDVPVPLGRWFQLETYVERSTTTGVVKVWVDGKLVFNLSNVRTKYDHTTFAITPARMNVGSENYGYSYPYYQYVDDLEIWNGLPVSASTLTPTPTPTPTSTPTPTPVPTSTSTLKFASGFEAPVQIVYTSSDRSEQRLGGGDVSGFSWSNLNHLFNYIVDGSVGYSVDTQLSTSRAHSGSRSLYQSQLRVNSMSRNTVEIYCTDGSSSSSNPPRLTNMKKHYTSRWIYWPSTLDLKPVTGWMAIYSTREEGDPEYSNILYLYKNQTSLYWYVRGIRYTDSQTTFYEGESHYTVPKGRWFHLETYIERSTTNGVFKVWVDGNLIFNFQNVKTSDGTLNFYINAAKVMAEADSGTQNFPLYQWVDDLQIRNGMPT